MRAAVVAMMLLCLVSGCTKAGTNSIGMELVEIPAGKFTMGDCLDNVAVTLTKPFGLGKTEVTQGQWKQVMGTEPWKGQDYVQVDKDCPATFISFFDAVEFCDKLTDLERKAGTLTGDDEYRLPTEAEWEYACRAGTKTAFSFGNESKLNSHAWWGGFDTEAALLDMEAALKGEFEAGPGNAAREQYAHKVGLKRANPWGLFDMHGNVFEWCSDWYGEKLSRGFDLVGPEDGSDRVLRGGSWWSGPDGCLSASRTRDVPSDHNYDMGFRVALCMGDRGVPRVETLDEQFVQLFQEGKYAEAEPLALQALEVSLKNNGPDHPRTATGLNNLASVYQTQGKYDLAEPLYKRALAIREKGLGPDHPRTAPGLNNLALLYETQDKYDLAEPLYNRAIAILDRALGESHPNTISLRKNLARMKADREAAGK